jgi:hypothetical protein
MHLFDQPALWGWRMATPNAFRGGRAPLPTTCEMVQGHSYWPGNRHILIIFLELLSSYQIATTQPPYLKHNYGLSTIINVVFLLASE